MKNEIDYSSQLHAITAAFFIVVVSTIIAAEINYQNASNAAKRSCGSDACIEQAMLPYGFDQDAMEHVNFYDKVCALFK